MMKTLLLVCTMFMFTQLQAQVALWNLKSLEAAKISDPVVMKSMIRNADKELTHTIKTVVDKSITAQSGDKHDYMSMGRYWWPDSSKADGLPYIRRDGISNPELEKLDRNPLGDMAKSVQKLSLAYYITADEKYAQKAVDNLRLWFLNAKTKMNPNLNYGQTIPGINNGLGRGEGVLDSYSFVEMLDGIELLKQSKAFTVADQQALKQWFKEYINWLQTSPVAKEERDAKNNHGTAYDVQLARYALFIGDIDLAKKTINEFSEKRIFSQVKPDGSQPRELARTTALGYSVFNLTHFLDMRQIGKQVGVDLLTKISADGRSILKAIDFLVPYLSKTVAEFPYQQIKDWGDVQEKLRWQLYRVDEMMGKPVYKKYYTGSLDLGKKNVDAILY